MHTSILAAAVLGFCAMPIYPNSIELVIMPGDVIKGHADLEVKCEKCHVRFDRDAQPRLCLDCHKDVASDIRDKQGYHGRLKENTCRKCHTEHKGRDAHIVALDEEAFEHKETDFLLRGSHLKTPCKECHQPDTKHRAAPSDCMSCHRKVDPHRANIGERCGDCHDENNWNNTRFDHSETEYILRDTHEIVFCNQCHIDQRYANTPRDCQGCHREDDKHKGNFVERCESCHE